MALTGNFVVNGLIVNNGYIRVERVVIHPKKAVPNAEVLVRVYPDSSKSVQGLVSLHEAVGSAYNQFFADTAVSPEGRHNQERAYNYLKSLFPSLQDDQPQEEIIIDEEPQGE